MGKIINSLLENTPDEFDDWVHSKVSELNKSFDEIKIAHQIKYNEIKEYFKRNNLVMDKRSYAMYVLGLNGYINSILFKMFEDKDYNNLIWKIIKPNYEKPFSNL